MCRLSDVRAPAMYYGGSSPMKGVLLVQRAGSGAFGEGLQIDPSQAFECKTIFFFWFLPLELFLVFFFLFCSLGGVHFFCSCVDVTPP
jgi:hypothetical protein